LQISFKVNLPKRFLFLLRNDKRENCISFAWNLFFAFLCLMLNLIFGSYFVHFIVIIVVVFFVDFKSTENLCQFFVNSSHFTQLSTLNSSCMWELKNLFLVNLSNIYANWSFLIQHIWMSLHLEGSSLSLFFSLFIRILFIE
jgi:fatty acid desaturase